MSEDKKTYPAELHFPSEQSRQSFMDWFFSKGEQNYVEQVQEWMDQGEVEELANVTHWVGNKMILGKLEGSESND